MERLNSLRLRLMGLVLGLVLAALPMLAFAQSDDGTGVALFGTLIWCFCLLIWFAIWGFMIYWVYTDAKKRGNPNAVVWAVVTFLVNWVGLLLYIVIGRNQGTTMGGPPPAGPTGPSTTARY